MSNKWLSGGRGTGDKILENWDDFSYKIDKERTNKDEGLYAFTWRFNSQSGNLTVKLVDGKMNSESQILTTGSSKHPFKTLQYNKDGTLFSLFTRIMQESYRILLQV